MHSFFMNAWAARWVGILISYRGFKACDSYANGEKAITQVTCPVLFVLGAQARRRMPKPQRPRSPRPGKVEKLCRSSVFPSAITKCGKRLN